MTNYRLLYITTKDKEEAIKIGKCLVEERLVACINMIDGMESMYWWQGQIEFGKECILLAKTLSSTVESIITRVKELHSYTCPCILSINIEDGNQEYLEWLSQEVKNSDGSSTDILVCE